MSHSELLDLWKAALTTAAMVGGPFLLVALVIGLLTSLIQAATQLQENVLSFAPKLIAVGLLLMLAGHSLLDQLTHMMTQSAEMIVQVGQHAGR